MAIPTRALQNRDLLVELLIDREVLLYEDIHATWSERADAICGFLSWWFRIIWLGLTISVF